MFTSIVKIENNRVVKFKEFNEAQDAQSHCEEYGGFVYAGAYSPDLWVDGEVVSVVPIVETPEQVIARLESAIDQHLDSVAQSYRYESIRAMVTYATSDHPTFGAEGRAAVKWRDACYDKAYKIQADVIAGLRQVPSEAELIAEMPPITNYL